MGDHDDRARIEAYATAIRAVFGDAGFDVYFKRLLSRERLPTPGELSDVVLLIHSVKTEVDCSEIEALLLAHELAGCVAFLKMLHSAALKSKDAKLGSAEAEIERLMAENKRLSEAVELADHNEAYMQGLIIELEGAARARKAAGDAHTQLVGWTTTESDGGSSTDDDAADGKTTKRGREGGDEGFSLKRSYASAR